MKRSVIVNPPPWMQASKITTTLLYKIILKSWGKENQNLYDKQVLKLSYNYKKIDDHKNNHYTIEPNKFHKNPN